MKTTHPNLELLLRIHPHADKIRTNDYAEAIDALSACLAACTICADACLGETEHLPRLRRCITTNLDCADVCASALRILARQTETPNDLIHAQLHACVIACQQCTDECTSHAAEHSHCKLCADACRHCQARCNFLLGEITSSGTAEAVDEEETPALQR